MTFPEQDSIHGGMGYASHEGTIDGVEATFKDRSTKEQLKGDMP
jgi:hypothetical protein